MRELKPLKLPLLVEARLQQEIDSPMDSPCSMRSTRQASRSSTSSDLPSPTFSIRGHSRLPSSTSSIASSPPIRDSADAFGAGRRPLTDVKEEPLEKIEDSELLDYCSRYEEFRRSSSSKDFHNQRLSIRDWTLEDPEAMQYLVSTEYDLGDDVLDTDFAPNPINKRQRGEGSALNGLASRLGSRMPSMSRRWRSRKVSLALSIPPMSRETSLSRANSSRAPSVKSRAPSIKPSIESSPHQLPPTPARSHYDECSDGSNALFIDTQAANAACIEDVEDHAKPTTPLLPPIMTQIPAHIKEVPYQSPLQSPTVADPAPASYFNSPVQTPQASGLPSPPLSTRPSITSFHRQQHYHSSPTVPSAETAPLPLNAPTDHWSDQLGHANFTIDPEPYAPPQPSLCACKQLRADWDAARSNYIKHLMRVGENYGPTSKIYLLTEQKWAEIDACWKRNTDTCFAHVADSSVEAALALSASEVIAEPPPLMKMPSLNGPKSEGKFPKLGDEGIVGPMDVAKPVQSPREQTPPSQGKKRKTGFLKWMQGVWPAGVGVFGRGMTGSP